MLLIKCGERGDILHKVGYPRKKMVFKEYIQQKSYQQKIKAGKVLKNWLYEAL
jgi:hypothetical protein